MVVPRVPKRRAIPQFPDANQQKPFQNMKLSRTTSPESLQCLFHIPRVSSRRSYPLPISQTQKGRCGVQSRALPLLHQLHAFVPALLSMVNLQLAGVFCASLCAWPGKGRWLPCALEQYPCEAKVRVGESQRGWGETCGEWSADCATRCPVAVAVAAHLSNIHFAHNNMKELS